MSKSQLKIDIEGFKCELKLLWVRDDTPFLGKVAKGVVLLVPVFNIANRCWRLWTRAIYRLDPIPEKIIFCENNSKDATLEIIRGFKLPHEVIRVWFKPDAAKGQPFDPIGHVRQLLLTRARTYGAKMAVFIDDDVIPERKDFIQQFLDRNLDICGGVYFREFPEGLAIASKWDTDIPLEELPYGTHPTIGKNVRKGIEITKENKMGYAIFRVLEPNKLYKVTITSGGALALGEKILKDRRMDFIPLRHDLGKSIGGTSEDFGFCLLAWHLGYTVYLDSEIKFTHMEAGTKDRPWMIDMRDYTLIPFEF